MICNGHSLLKAEPITKMTNKKHREHGVSWGQSEVGYDLRTKQKIDYFPPDPIRMVQTIKTADEGVVTENYTDSEINKCFFGYTRVYDEDGAYEESIGRTALASSIEHFNIPCNLWGELRNKSTHARRFIDATIGTDMEPGWKGHLTIEIIFHGTEPITIPAGSGIAKAVFHELRHMAEYEGKYQEQPDMPVPAKYE